MPILNDQVYSIIALLRDKARTKRTASYSELFKLFPPDTEKTDVFYTLEEACRQLAPRDVAIYDSLLATARTGLPGDGFFDIYKNTHYHEFVAAYGNIHIVELSPKQRAEITAKERERVYRHV